MNTILAITKAINTHRKQLKHSGNPLPIPNFAGRGITDLVTILHELDYGAPVTIFVGPSRTEFSISKRLLTYHTPTATQILTKSSSDTYLDIIELPLEDPKAFAYLRQRLHLKSLGVLQHCTANTPSIAEGIQEACTILCRVYFLAVKLALELLYDEIIEELLEACARAQEMKHPPPLRAEIILEVYTRAGEGSLLWDFVLEEMCIAFRTPPLPAYADYEVCFSIDEFRLAVTGSMCDVLTGRSY